MKERKPTAKQFKFANNIIDGMTQADAYRNAYDVLKMTDKTVIEKASLLANQDNIRAMVEKGKKELENADIWTRKQSLQEIVEIIKVARGHMEQKVIVSKDGTNIEVQEFNASAANTAIRAIEQANKMCGYNEPDKIDSTITVVLSGELEEWGK